MNSEVQQDIDLNLELPSTMLFHKEVSEEDLKKIEEQWKKVIDLSVVDVPNDIRIRQAAGMKELTEGTLIHGTSFDLDKLRSIKEKGIISGEILGIPEDCETHYCADFFRVPQNMSVGEYIKWYDRRIKVGRVIMPMMERNRLPSTTGSESLGFIINTTSSDIVDLLKMDAYRPEGYEALKNIITQLPRDIEGPEAKRLSAILCGIPSNFISGIIIHKKIVEDRERMMGIKDLFGVDVVYFDVNGREIM